MTASEDQQEYAEAHRGLGSLRGDARKREGATLNSGFRVAAEQVADSIDSVTDSVSPEQRAAIEADVLRRVAGQLDNIPSYVTPRLCADDRIHAEGRDDELADVAELLRDEADRIEEGAR